MNCQTIEYLQTNITAKLRFPSATTKNYWAVQELSERSLFAVPFIGILIIIACANPITKKSLYKYLLTKTKCEEEKFEKILNTLILKKIIVFSNSTNSNIDLFDDFEHWLSSGWGNAAHYHFYTWNSPFLDYTKEGNGHEIDRKNMVAYQQKEPDTLRCKSYPSPLSIIPLPTVDPISENISAFSISDKIKLLLSCSFSKTGEKPCHWTNIPLIRRTSPSGGSRHPTEGYLFAHSLDDIKKGCYHIHTEDASLHRIKDETRNSYSELIEFEDIAQSASGTIVLTSIFEKNMYRYRESRTFRTIHMDVGHILANIEMLAKELNIKIRIHLNFNEDNILKYIGASKYEEGVMAAVSLFAE